MTDRLYELSNQIAALIEELRDEAERRSLTDLQAPVSWLEESNRWLNHALARAHGAVPPARAPRDAVPFTYIPAELRK